MMNDRIAILKSFIEEDPGDAFNFYALALEYINQGDHAEARVLMEQLYLTHPEYLANYYHYGKLLERFGEADRAILIYSEGEKVALLQKNQKTYNELRSAREEIM